MKIYLLLILFTLQLYAQVESIHKIESEYYSKQHLSESIAHLNSGFANKSKGSKLNKVVFGYLPYWEYSKGSYLNLRYDLLSHLAVFSFEADKNGNLKVPFNWPWTPVIDAARNYNVKLILCVTNFNGNDIHGLLTDSAKQKFLIDNIMKYITQFGFNGVNIDFESLLTTDRGTVIGDFAKALKSEMSKVNTVLELSFALPVVNWSGWNFDYIAKNCDHIFIMGYDFYGSWSITTGPTAPLTGTTYNISRALQNDYAVAIANQPNKILLGVPYYGNYWKPKTKDPFTPVDTSKAKREWVSPAPRYRDLFPLYDSKEKLWDNVSSTPWLRWQDATWNQIWYDNDSSLALKYNLALQKKLGGIGIWALGYDNGKTELWNLIERKFTTTGINESNLPPTFRLYQNYPNPFNSETVISYQLPVASYVTLKVYDVLGREVATLVDEFRPAGTYNSQLSIINSQLCSGVYFYRLTSGNYSATRKLILMK